jgi:hypothetical protein
MVHLCGLTAPIVYYFIIFIINGVYHIIIAVNVALRWFSIKFRVKYSIGI